MERELPEQKTRGSIVSNGEVYNHRALRKELASSWDFRSNSDTEVLLAGYLLYGPSFFSRANAMSTGVALSATRSVPKTKALVIDFPLKKILFAAGGCMGIREALVRKKKDDVM